MSYLGRRLWRPAPECRSRLIQDFTCICIHTSFNQLRTLRYSPIILNGVLLCNVRVYVRNSMSQQCVCGQRAGSRQCPGLGTILCVSGMSDPIMCHVLLETQVCSSSWRNRLCFSHPLSFRDTIWTETVPSDPAEVENKTKEPQAPILPAFPSLSPPNYHRVTF